MKHYCIILILFLTANQVLRSQSIENFKDNKGEYLNTYDATVGLENTGLYNGIQFKDQSRSADGTFRFYNDGEFTKGTVVFDGQLYKNVLLKYDILEDVLITHSDDDLSIFHLQLVTNKVSYFSIFSKEFVRLKFPDRQISKLNDFYELLYKGNSLTLYEKHYKNKKEVLKGTFLAYSYNKESYFLLENNGKYNIIETIRDCRKTLPERKEAINDFYNSYKNLYKTDREKFMILLFQTLDNSNFN